MQVIKNDCIVNEKNNAVYRVFVADDSEFVACRMTYDAKEAKWISDYGIIKPFKQDDDLEAMGFKKAKIKFDTPSAKIA